MRVVAVGGVVQVDKLRPRHREDAQDVGADVRLARVLQIVAGITELHHDAVFPDERGLALLLLAHVLHLFVGVFLVGSLARAARAIGDDDAAEPLVVAAETIRDSVIRGDLQVVLVRDNAEVGHAREGLRGVALIGNEKIGFRMAEEHGAEGRWSARAAMQIGFDRAPGIVGRVIRTAA